MAPGWVVLGQCPGPSRTGWGKHRRACPAEVALWQPWWPTLYSTVRAGWSRVVTCGSAAVKGLSWPREPVAVPGAGRVDRESARLLPGEATYAYRVAGWNW
jgi:hypothetical protein